jgi:DNA polymerase III alpha subunit
METSLELKFSMGKLKNKELNPLSAARFISQNARIFPKEDKIDASGDHLILLAKNKEGYHNLVNWFLWVGLMECITNQGSIKIYFVNIKKD